MSKVSQYEALSELKSAVLASLAQSDPAVWGFDVFISYRTADTGELAKAVHKTLKRSQHPNGRKRLRVFLDEEEISVGQNIDGTLAKALQKSHTFILLFSREYAKTEYTTFEQLLVGGIDPGSVTQRIVPVKVGQCEIPDRFKNIKYLQIAGEDSSRHVWPAYVKATFAWIVIAILAIGLAYTVYAARHRTPDTTISSLLSMVDPVQGPRYTARQEQTPFEFGLELDFAESDYEGFQQIIADVSPDESFPAESTQSYDFLTRPGFSVQVNCLKFGLTESQIDDLQSGVFPRLYVRLRTDDNDAAPFTFPLDQITPFK